MAPIYGESAPSSIKEFELVTVAGGASAGSAGFVLRSPVRFEEGYDDDYEEEGFEEDDSEEDDDFDDDDFDDDDDDDDDDDFDDDEDDDFDYDDDMEFDDLEE